MDKRGKPTPLAEALAAYLQRSGLGDRIEETSVLDDWAGRVGPRIAAVATPVQVGDGVLVVAVDSSAWLMELRLMETEIRQRLNEGRETGRVRRIRFVLADGSDPEQTKSGPGGRRGPGGNPRPGRGYR
jgi:predicted nucleic acid-binding Zn ribbon protein